MWSRAREWREGTDGKRQGEHGGVGRGGKGREVGGEEGEREERGSFKGRADTLRNLNPRHLRPPQVAESREHDIPETSHIGITGQ